MRKGLILGVAVIGLGAIPFSRSNAGIPVGIPAQEMTQLLNYVQLVANAMHQLQLIQTALSTYSEVVRAGQVLSHMQWSNVERDLRDVAQVAQLGSGLSFSLANADQQFRTIFPGYAANTSNTAPFSQRYQQWSQMTLDTLHSAVRVNGRQWQQLQTESGLTRYLEGQSQSSLGQMQAIQVGNQASVELIKQFQKLRQLFLQDMQSKQTFQAAEVQRGIEQHQAEDRFYRPARAHRDGIAF